MFSHSGSAAAQGRSRQQVWILTSSVALHALAFATLGVVQLWHVEAVAEPPAHDVFQVQLPPPQPEPETAPTGGGKVAPAAGAATARFASPANATVVQHPPETEFAPNPSMAALATIPTPTTPVAPAPSTRWDGLPDSIDAISRSAGGTGGKGGGGPDGGGPGIDDAPLAVGGAIARPQILQRIQPLYTDRARQTHLQGTVILQATIDELGNVVDVQVVKRLPMGLDEEAVKAVRHWKFTPATLQGRPVKVYFDLTVVFQVN